MNHPMTAYPAILGEPAPPFEDTVEALRLLLESYDRGIERAAKRLGAETDPAERKLIETGLRLTREHRDEIAARLRDAEEQERNMAAKKTTKKKASRKPRATEAPESTAISTPETPPEESNPTTELKPAETAKPPSIERRHYTDHLAVKLTDAELLERGKQQSKILRAIEDAEAAAKREAQHRKTDIEEQKASLRKISVEVRDGATFRDVDCEHVHDFLASTVTDIRLDTGEVLGVRAMRYEEKQRSLGLAEPPKAAAQCCSPGDDEEDFDDEDQDDDDEDPPLGEPGVSGPLESEADDEGVRMGGRGRRQRSGAEA